MKYRSIVAALRTLILGAFLTGLFAATSGAQTLTLQLPLSRFSHGFALHYWDASSGSENTLFPDSSLLSPGGSQDGNGQFQLAPDSFLELTFSLDASTASQWYLLDSTSGEGAPLNGLDIRSTIWSNGPPLGGWASSSLRYFSLPMSRYQDAFTVIGLDGTSYVVTQNPEEGQYVTDPNTGNVIFQGFGFFTASANVAGAMSFNLVDLTSVEQAAQGATELINTAWAPLSLPSIVHSVTIVVGDANAGTTFTLHTSGGSLQSVTPSYVDWTDPVSQEARDGYVVTGAAGIGEDFWLTRDIDGFASAHARMLVSDLVVDWSAGIPDLPARNMQSLTFRIGQGRDGHTLSIHHGDGFVTYLYVAPWNSFESNSLVSYYANGLSFSYYYTDFLANVDTNQTWTLFDETAHQDLGGTQSVMEGYTPYAPPSSILISSLRRGHALVLHQADGVTVNLQSVPGYDQPGADLSAWNYFYSGEPDGDWFEIKYFPMTADFDKSQGFTIEDQTVGDQTTGAIQWNETGYFVDLSQWSTAPSSLGLNIAGSRWTHQLWLHQSNGESFLLTKGNAQGVWAQDQQSHTWFISYGYFDASTSYHAELDWWIYDATSGEVSPRNQTDLTQWASYMDSTDSDGDGLPDWYEYVVGTNPNAVDSDGDGIPDAYELYNGLNPMDASDASQPYSGGPLTNLQVYQGYQIYTFQLPLGRAGHNMAFMRSDANGGEWMYGPLSSQMTAIAGVDADGRLVPSADSYWEVSFAAVVGDGAQWWLNDQTVGEGSQINTFDVRQTPWGIGQPYGSEAEVPVSYVRYLALPVARAQNVFNLILDSGETFPVTVGSEVMGSGVNPSTGQMENSGCGFVAATAYPVQSGNSIHVLDLTAFQQGPADATDLAAVAWSPISLPTITRAVSIALAPSNDGFAFTIHTSGGSLQGSTAWYSYFTNDSGGYLYSGTGISASVGIGETYWVTRDVDGASSPQLQMGVSNTFVDWTAPFAPFRNFQTTQFQIGAGRRGHVFGVHQPDGYVAYLYPLSYNDQLTTWDDNGQPINYAYDTFNALVDGMQTWTLVDENTGEDLGATTAVLEGWTPWHPAAPAGFVGLTISQFRHSHHLQLRQQDGTMWNVQASPGYEDVSAYLQSWNSNYGRTAAIDYFPAQAPYDPYQSFTIIDVDRGEEFSNGMNPTDLSQWTGPPESVVVNISVTRWAHELIAVQTDGATYTISRGNLQGSWTPTLDNQGWFTTYNYFDAQTQVRPALDWWIYDVTANEFSEVNPSDLSQWLGGSAQWDSDGDTLPDWFEFVLGSNPYSGDSDGDGIPDEWEVRHGLNPANASDAFAISQGGDLTNLQKYQNGLNPLVSDTDGDGISDAWELAHGLNPLDPADAAAMSPTQPWLTNLQVSEGYVAIPMKLPLGRTGHAFSLSVPYQGGPLDYSPISARPDSMTVAGDGSWQLAGDSNLSVVFAVQMENLAAGNMRLSDFSTGDYLENVVTSGEVLDLHAVPWQGLDTPVGCFAVPISRQGDTFSVARTDGVTTTVTPGAEQGENIYDPQTGITSFHSFGFFTVTAFPTPGSGDLYLVDLTTREQTLGTVTGAGLPTWAPLNLPQIVRTVTIKLSDNDVGFAYTLHTSGGSLQGVWPAWGSVQFPGSTDPVSGYFVSGVVGAGENFWLTRDVDTFMSPQDQVVLSDVLEDWSGVFPSRRNFQTVGFRIGQDRATHILSIHHADGLVEYLYYPSWGLFTTWDDNGETVFYGYDDFQAQVDTNQSWTLFDEQTGESLGQITELLEGWAPWHPAPPAGFVAINLPQFRHGHGFRLRQDDGTTWNIAPSPGYTDPQAYLQTWNTYFSGTGDERTEAISYFPAQGPFDPNQGFTVIDTTSGEEQAFTAGAGSADLSQWYSTPMPLSFNISVVRWAHELVLHQANGESFPISRGSLRGDWWPHSGSNAWFVTYNCFDAPTQFHPELEYWVYDVTTGESSASNTTDLINWSGSALTLDTDGDGLPDWYEFIIGTDPNVNDGNGNGIPDWWEHQNFGPAGLQLLLSPAERAALALGAAWANSPFTNPSGTANPGGGNTPWNTDPTPGELFPPELTVLPQRLTPSSPQIFTKADLTWVGAADNFTVDRKVSSGDWVTIATFGPTGHEYVDETVLAGERYQYRVIARSGALSATSMSKSYEVPLFKSLAYSFSYLENYLMGFYDSVTQENYLTSTFNDGQNWHTHTYDPPNRIYTVQGSMTYSDPYETETKSYSITIQDPDLTMCHSTRVLTRSSYFDYTDTFSGKLTDEETGEVVYSYSSTVVYSFSYVEHISPTGGPSTFTGGETTTTTSQNSDGGGGTTVRTGTVNADGTWSYSTTGSGGTNYGWMTEPIPMWGSGPNYENPYSQEQFISDSLLDQPGYIDMGDLGFTLPFWLGYFWVDDVQGYLRNYKTKYKVSTYPSIPMDVKLYEIFVPRDDPSTPEDERRQARVVSTREWHIDQTHDESPEYKRNPASERENGEYWLSLVPTLDVWDGTSAGTGVFLDDTEKQASGAAIQFGQTEGTTGFTVGGQSHLPGEEYKITWDNTDFQIIDQQTGETLHGDLTINEDNWFHSFAIVAGPHAAPGEQVHITLDAMLNGQVFSTDQFLAKITDDPHFNHYTLPIDDASGPKYRKIALNGRPMADEKPQHTAESNQEKEESFIDAMTLGLRHSVTDIFVPIPGSDLVLSARRDVSSTVWNMKGGFRPHEHIDWPFGPGWTSSLAPKVDIVAAPGQPVYAYLTDEHGSSHRFIQYVGADGIHYVPSPSSRTENSDYLSSFDGTTFTSRYGTAITFASAGNDVSIAADRTNGANGVEAHRYLRAVSVTDRLGKTVNFTYSGNSLVPDVIAVDNGPNGQSQKISLRHDAQGRVTQIWDPKGLQTTFTYGPMPYSQGGVDYSVQVLTQVTGPDTQATQYTYDLAVETDLTPPADNQTPTPKLHLDLASITDPLGQTYSFTYQWDHSKHDFRTDTGYFSQTGLPRNISRVNLPDGNHADFVNNSYLALEYDGLVPRLTANSLRQTQVTDAANTALPQAQRKSTTYTWGAPQVFLLNNLSQNAIEIPKMVCFTEMTVDYSGLGTQVYTFDLTAGLAVKRVQDFFGHVTEFTYGDAWTAPASYRTVFSLAGFNGNYSDPTVQTNALGQQKFFAYSGAWRIMSWSQDEALRTTTNVVDNLGRRTKETIADEHGAEVQVTEFHYTNAAFPGVVTERIVKGGAGFPDLVTQYELDSEGRVQNERVDLNGLNLVTQSAYDANGCKISSTDPNGNTIYFGYDVRNRLTGIAYPGQTQKAIAYDARGNKLSETDENNHLTRFTYDKMNRLTEQRRVMAAGAGDIVSSFAYNEVGSRIGVTDPRGNTTNTDYDSLQRPTQITDPLGNATKFWYEDNSGANAFDSSSFKATKMEDARHFVTSTVNDALYRPTDVRVVYGAGGEAAVTHTVYDAVGNATSVTDPLGKTTVKGYDALNRVVKVTFHDGTTNLIDYTPTGLKWRVTDELGHQTTTEFDGAGRPVKVHAPVLADGVPPATTETIYDSNGNVVATIDPMGGRTDVTYDARNRKVRVAGPPVVVNYATGEMARPLTDTAYDAVGNVIRVTDPRNYVTTMTYDEANRKTQVVAPAVPVAGQQELTSPVTTMQYDLAGNVHSVTDADGHVTVNTYDAMNRLLTTTVHALVGDPGIVVANEYDPVGNRVTVTDGEGHSTRFTYDGMKRNTTIVDALNHTTTFGYNVVNKTSRAISGMEEITSYLYDDRHRLTGVQYSVNGADNRTYVYDAAGRLTSVSEPGKGGKADVAYAYDAMNRVVTETSGGVTHQYSYDLAGNRLQVTYGGTNRTLVSTYDALNRLLTVTENGRATQYQYDLSGNVVRKELPSGDAVITSYDAMNRSVTIEGVTMAPAHAGQVLYQYAQARDALGNVTAIAEQTASLPARFVSMGYDGVDRLTSEQELTGAQGEVTTYTYDRANNRVSRTRQGVRENDNTSYIYDPCNRLTSIAGTGRSVTYEYNAAGSRTKQTENGVVKASYTYDGEQRLVALTQDSHTYAYTYDYRTRRVERIEDGAATKVIFSGGTSVQEMVGNALAVEYVRGSDWGGGVGGILYTLRGDVPSFTHYDSRGDVTAKTDTNGAVTYQASYESFGKRTQEQGSTADRQKANTKEEDPSGLLNEGMRFRDLETGTFITADPAGFVDGPNLYAYVRQNPWTKFDPEGLSPGLEIEGLASEEEVAKAMEMLVEPKKSTTPQGLLIAVAITAIKATADWAAPKLDKWAQPFASGGVDSCASGSTSTGQPSKPEKFERGLVMPLYTQEDRDAYGQFLATGDRRELDNYLATRDKGGGPKSDGAQKGPTKEDLDKAYPRVTPPKGFAEKVWEENKAKDGKVYDPSGVEIKPGDYWELGHKPEHKFEDAQKRAYEQDWPTEMWRQYQKDPGIYRPELQNSNRSHRYESDH